MNSEQARNLIRETFTQAFDKNRFIFFARNLLNQIREDDKAGTMAVPEAFAPHVRSCWRVGTYEVPGGELADVLIVHTTEPWKLERTRTALRDFVAHKLKRGDSYKEAGLVAFVSPDARSWRFSYVRMEYETKRDPKTGKIAVEERLTPARRYSYLVGEGESCHTAQTRFLDLLEETDNNPTLAQLEEAFSVEKVTKQFFEDFSRIVEKVVADILNRNRGWTPQQADREAQTLLSRLLFLYFVQRKGWLDRRRDYLYSKCKEYFVQNPEGTSCYDQFLKSLFVKLSDADAYFPNLELGDVPFLNGGLFDDDMGSLTDRGRMKVGNPVLRDVFEKLLELYNFTVREDTPLEQEVAIDPEMLGKIFESLVLQLEQSNTGGKTSRHDTGSYYTPRPIVHYLCREGLRAWLEQFPPSVVGRASPRADSPTGKKTAAREDARPTENDWPTRLEKLFSIDASEGINKNQRAILDSCLTPEEARALVDRLDNFRACDPAVGSGAFLVGLLHELVSLHRLCETRARGKGPADGDTDWLYNTKKRIIENVLYGVDIQERAVEICKLRLWLSLMVDYPLDVVADNCALADFRKALKKITPLPNLDFKIRRADSLIEQIRGHAIKFPQAVVDSRDLALSLNRLGAAKHRFYEAQNKKEKRAARLDILDATAELAQYEFNAAKLKFGLLPSDKDAERLGELAAAEAEMGHLKLQIAVARKKSEREKDDDIERLGRVFDDETKPTFVWQLDFAEIFHQSADSHARENLLPAEKHADKAVRAPSGFDLALANPPYLRQEKFKDQKPLLQNAYDCYTGVADLYVYFYERAVKLLGNGGVLSFISSNKFFRAGYGEKLRKYLADNCHIRSIIDFGELPVFTAGTDPAIIIATKVEPRPNNELQTAMIKDAAEIDQLTYAVAAHRSSRLQSTLQAEGWTLENSAVLSLLAKLRRVGKPLNEVVSRRFYYGIKTGLNEAFVVDRATRDQLVAEHRSSAEVLKPFVHGSDAKKWKVDLRDDWLIFTRRGINIEKYPAILRHLSQFREALTPGGAKGRKPGSYKWYEIQDNIAYWQEFKESKIIFNETSKELHAFFDETGLYTNKTLFMLIAPQPKPLLAVLLSRTLDWLFRHEFPSWGDPWKGGRVQFRGDRMETVPIPDFPPKNEQSLTKLVDRILSAKQRDAGADVSALEREIDELVYALYGLTPAEIKIVEDATK